MKKVTYGWIELNAAVNRGLITRKDVREGGPGLITILMLFSAWQIAYFYRDRYLRRRYPNLVPKGEKELVKLKRLVIKGWWEVEDYVDRFNSPSYLYRSDAIDCLSPVWYTLGNNKFGNLSGDCEDWAWVFAAADGADGFKGQIIAFYRLSKKIQNSKGHVVYLPNNETCISAANEEHDVEFLSWDGNLKKLGDSFGFRHTHIIKFNQDASVKKITIRR